MKTFKICNADCLHALRYLPESSVDSVVTDPPAGISFMGKDWDKDKGGRQEWVKWMTEVMQECLRVLKPGGHALVWAIPRTAHWTATALEDAGFEVRDCITHIFGSGFPKSLDISKAIDKMAGAEREVVGPGLYRRTNSNPGILDKSSTWTKADPVITAPATPEAKQWNGWGTALKPACEFWWLVRKPLGEKTVAKNVLKWGTGGINIDGCRVATEDSLNGGAYSNQNDRSPTSYLLGSTGKEYVQPEGRFPANLIVDESAVEELDRQSGDTRSSSAPRKNGINTTRVGGFGGDAKERVSKGHNDTGGASRFFYCAKASKRDRGEGNGHPTVKSTKLMEYLIRLITPPGGTVLDPFMGSGSTGVAALKLGFKFFGIEMEQEYFEIAKRRLEHVSEFRRDREDSEASADTGAELVS